MLPAALAPLAPVSWAQTAAAPASGRLPTEEFFKPANLRGATLSPDGNQIAAIRSVQGRDNIIVFDLTTSKSLIITNFRDTDVASVQWVMPGRVSFTVIDRSKGLGNQDPPALFAINSDASAFRQLAGIRADDKLGDRLLPPGTGVERRIAVDGKLTDEMLVSVPTRLARGRFASTLYRLNTTNGRSTLVSIGGPPDVLVWITDTRYEPRAAVSSSDGKTRLHVRPGTEWSVAAEWPNAEPERAISPVAIDADGVLYVTAYANGSDVAALHRFDMKTAKLDPQPVFGAPGYDVGSGAMFRNGRLIGVEFEGEREQVVWFDDERKAVQAAVDKMLPGAVNDIQWALERPQAPVLILSRSDRDPGRYLLFDVAKNDIKQIAAVRPAIKPEAMAPTTFFRYAARDGMSIPAQLTLPAREGKLPLVVLHYGGPWVRPISWGWDPIVQFLASRGYAVFMPAPRASTGFGMKLYKAGWKQWGLAMQDDVTDGVKYLIGQGRIDPKRVCIAGASYGGYMTMMGLVKEPDLFRVGVNWIGVTDASYMLSVGWTDFNRSGGAEDTLNLLVGDLEKDKEQFRQTSAVERAKEIKQPVLMAYGGLDQRVPIINGDRMRNALKGHNPNVEWVVYPDEGHGWLRMENNVDFMNRFAAFLEKHMAA